MAKIVILMFLVIMGINDVLWVRAECSQCQRNGVACVGRNEFYICGGARPLPGVKFVCPRANEVCTNATIVCDLESNYGISCANNCNSIDFVTEQDEFCAQHGTTGWYKDKDYSSCNTFILCFYDDDNLLRGTRKRCPKSMSFNSVFHYCHIPESETVVELSSPHGVVSP